MKIKQKSKKQKLVKIKMNVIKQKLNELICKLKVIFFYFEQKLKKKMIVMIIFINVKQ